MTNQAHRTVQKLGSSVKHKPGILNTLSILLCFSVFALPPLLFVVTPLGTTVPLIMARVCAVALIVISILHRNRFIKFVQESGKTECVLLVGLVLIFGLSLFHSHISQHAILEYLKILIGILLYFPLRALIGLREVHEFGYMALLGTIIGSLLILTNNLLYIVSDNNLNLVAPVYHRHGEIFLSVIIWPIALIFKNLYPKRKSYLLLLIIPFLAIATGENQSSQLALICGLIVFCACWFAGGLAMIIFFMIIISVLIVTLTWWLPQIAHLGSLEALSPFFGRGDADARLSIWLAYIDVINLRFWYGWGFEAWREIQELVGQRKFLDWHPHNAFVEIWITLGLFGALIIAIFEICLLMGICRLESSIRSYFLATFVSANVIAFVSHGWLQVWWLETLFISAILLLPFTDRKLESQSPAFKKN